MLVNLTPHPIRLRVEANLAPEPLESDIVLPSAGQARVVTQPGSLADHGLPVPVATPTTYGAIEGLPEPDGKTIYIVSLICAQAARRFDVLSPGTGPSDEPVRDAAGRIYAVTRLIAHV